MHKANPRSKDQEPAKGVMLVNMGGPLSPGELKIFLARMFRDPFILPYGKIVRSLLSFLISRSRYRKSWKKYELVGGTPLVASTRETSAALQEVLGRSYRVKYAFSYSDPDIRNCFSEFKDDGIRDIIILPLYPQSSHTTTSSVIAEVEQITATDPFFRTRVIGEFCEHPGFVSFWASNIQKHLEMNKIEDPTLVFSAHSIPEYNLEKGDTYATSIVRSAELIATRMNLPYEAAFQSAMRRGKWIGPDVKEHLAVMREEGIDNLVLIPVSFVHENLETLYDLDREIIPYASGELGFTNVSRVRLPAADPLLVSLLADLVTSRN